MEGRGLQADPKELLWVQIAGRPHNLARAVRRKQLAHMGDAGLHSERLGAANRLSAPQKEYERDCRFAIRADSGCQRGAL
jgi:hypothetical protein